MFHEHEVLTSESEWKLGLLFDQTKDYKALCQF